MKTSRKVMAMIMAAAMLLSLMAGCSDGKASTTATTKADAPVATETPTVITLPFDKF